MNRSNRRQFVTGLGSAVLVAAASNTTTAAGAATPAPQTGQDWAKIRGFNYQPSYGSSGLELWQKFDATIIETELSQGKQFFPHMNALRWWSSPDGFARDPQRYAKNFETTLRLADKYGCKVMPVLFNRWHSAELDYGGIYLDDFVPGSMLRVPHRFDAYLEAVVGAHRDDPRILAWDLCNEPYSYDLPESLATHLPKFPHLPKSAPRMPQAIVEAETAWLRGVYDKCKQLGANAPVTVGMQMATPLELIEPISDVISFHPYWIPNLPSFPKSNFETQLDAVVAYARKVGKPLISTECCWGDLDDKARVDVVR
jgi:hypothetical protein